MSTFKRTILLAVPAVATFGAMAAWTNLGHADAPADTGEAFPLATHDLLPHPSGRHVAFGRVDENEVLEQPIAYSHMLHAGTLQIDCEYCHSNARRSIHAGVPSTETCMNCHKMIDTTGRPELDKLKGYWERQEEIPWMKVHDLPDFVYFSHKRHVRAGVACQECHGQVQDVMTVAQRVAPLNMGWCLECHKTHPSVNENYGAQAELRRAEMKDCYTCHK
ncbi:cytochrome c family protein [Myxococcota bacterium]|nr:cytochrome c family protein [Myxococcota bacterium]